MHRTLVVALSVVLSSCASPSASEAGSSVDRTDASDGPRIEAATEPDGAAAPDGDRPPGDTSRPADSATPAGKWRFVKVAGDGAVLISMFPGTDPLRVLAVKDDGTPGIALSIDWTVTKGSVVLVETIRGTNSSGMAQTMLRGDGVAPGVSWTDATVTASTTLPDGAKASLDFHVVTVTNNAPSIPAPPLAQLLAPDPATRDLGDGKVGDVIPGAVRVVVAAQTGTSSGQPIAGIGLRMVNPDDPAAEPVAVCVGGTAMTDDKGVARCDLKLLHETPAGRLQAMVGGYVFFDRIQIRIGH